MGHPVTLRVNSVQDIRSNELVFCKFMGRLIHVKPERENDNGTPTRSAPREEPDENFLCVMLNCSSSGVVILPSESRPGGMST